MSLFDSLFGEYGGDLAIDIGTANTLVAVRGQGIVINEPSVVAIDKSESRVLAVGADAKRMIGRTPGSIIAERPLKDGVIAEFDITAAMLRHYFKKVSGNTIMSRPRVSVCIPYGVTEVEKRAVEDVTLEAGAQSVSLIEEPIAAAIGSGLRVEDARGCMIVDIGGGTTEVAVLSLGGIVLSTSLRIAGDELDESIIAYIKRKYNILIGDVTAEMLKKRIGSVHPAADRGEMRVQGRNLLNGLPAIVGVSSAEIREAMEDQVQHIVESIRTVTDVPCAIGFGISTPEQAKAMASISDGAIVGSAIVKIIAKYGKDAAPYIGEYVKSMKEAVAE